MFIRLSHLTRYDYSEPVSFSPHALYLRPRETARQRLHHFSLETSPVCRIVSTTDPLDNAVDWAYFGPEHGSRLDIRTEMMVETLDANPFDFFLKPSVLDVPFSYDVTERTALLPALTPRADSPPPSELRAWLDARMPEPPTSTVAYLTAMNETVHRSLRYSRRDEQGVQPAGATLALGGGSCRDYAVLLIELCRSVGIAARFVSGYVHEGPSPGASPGPISMHAWAEVYLPGAGWRGLDATRGLFCDDAFVPVAHAAFAENVSPVQGTFIGSPGVVSRMTTELSIVRL